MSVTVADCLKLPALKESNVVAGYSGLNRPVCYRISRYGNVIAGLTCWK